VSNVRFDRSMSIPVRPGTTIFIAKVARTGEHRYGDGERGGRPAGTERRDSIELRKIVEQLPNKPITLGHPQGLISRGVPAKIVGKVTRSWIEGEFAVAEFRVDSDEAIHSMIHRGIRELSLGYTTDADANGDHRNTRVDHVALVSSARCGAECCIRADHACDGSGEHLRNARKNLALASQLLATRK
jgi:hypothetical protein